MSWKVLEKSLKVMHFSDLNGKQAAIV